jgi:anti-sigma factor ChrR (cupin superfamily)
MRSVMTALRRRRSGRRPAVLADLGRVDVGVDDLGERREGRQLAGDPVVEPGAEGDEQVGLLQAGDGGDRAVHARHAQVERVAVGEGAAGHQGGHDRDLVSSTKRRSSSLASARITPPPT